MHDVPAKGKLAPLYSFGGGTLSAGSRTVTGVKVAATHALVSGAPTATCRLTSLRARIPHTRDHPSFQDIESSPSRETKLCNVDDQVVHHRGTAQSQQGTYICTP